VADKRRRDLHDLNFLLRKTQVYENPGDELEENLKKICLQFGINNPIIGDE
jgi:hypothetical protein